MLSHQVSANFCQKYKIFDKSEKSDLVAANFQFWHSKVHQNLSSHKVFQYFLLGHQVFWRNFAQPRFCFHRTSIPTLIREATPQLNNSNLLAFLCKRDTMNLLK